MEVQHLTFWKTMHEQLTQLINIEGRDERFFKLSGDYLTLRISRKSTQFDRIC